MYNIPINIDYGDYGFRYAVTIDDKTSDLFHYQYKIVNREDELDEHPYHNIDHVQFISATLDDLEKDSNLFYNIPNDPDKYNFAIYDSHGDTAGYGIASIISDDPPADGNTTISIISCNTPGWAGQTYIIHSLSVSYENEDLYNSNDEPTGYKIMMYPYVDGALTGNMPDNPVTGEDVPKIKSRKVIFNLPWFKIDNYKRTEYSLRFTTWISGVEVVLGDYKISGDMYRAAPYHIYKEGRYAEYATLYIIDPWSLIYGDEWAVWREEVCGERTGDMSNNTGSSISVTLTAIGETEDYYSILSNSSIGNSNITISETGDFVRLDIKFRYGLSDIFLEIGYNESYNNICEYLYETYGIDIPETGISAKYTLIISDKENELGMVEATVTPADHEQDVPDSVSYIESHVFEKDELGITDWSEYKDGLFLYGNVDILNGDGDVEFSIISDPIPVTPDVYKYLIITDLDDLNIKLSNVQMWDYNIHAVNKISKNVIQVENAKDYKSNIIRPVFFRVSDIGNVAIHPEVTENVCLSLNAYKSKVGFFYAKIEGVSFSEIGRNHNGVIFKIQGNLLPRKTESGVIYILNEDMELVTTGRFEYIS